MNPIVLDANTALDWFIPSHEGNAYSAHLIPLVSDGQIEFVVPLHFDIEVSSVLVRKHRKDPDTFSTKWLDAALQTLDMLPIQITAIGMNFQLLGQLSQSFNLSVYDTPYLQLARLMEIPLATRDRGLIAACDRWHVLRWKPV